MELQSPRAALFFENVIVIPPFALKSPMLGIRPPLLHIFAVSRTPSFQKRRTNRRFPLRREFR
jgi:hypothetical protein